MTIVSFLVIVNVGLWVVLLGYGVLNNRAPR